MNRLWRVAGFLLIFCPLTLLADAATIEGRWLTQNRDGWIQITIQGDLLEGSIAGSPNDDEEREFDDRNPDPALRSRRLKGLTIMTGFQSGGDGRWTGGRIYDPNTGKTYKGTVTRLDANTLKIRGFIGVSLFGRSETWTRDDPERLSDQP